MIPMNSPECQSFNPLILKFPSILEEWCSIQSCSHEWKYDCHIISILLFFYCHFIEICLSDYYDFIVILLSDYFHLLTKFYDDDFHLGRPFSRCIMTLRFVMPHEIPRYWNFDEVISPDILMMEFPMMILSHENLMRLSLYRILYFWFFESQKEDFPCFCCLVGLDFDIKLLKIDVIKYYACQ